MNADWQVFLQQAGAVFGQDRNGVAHFGNLAEELQQAVAGDVICDLSHQGLLAAGGTGAGSFLQGQLSNDIDQMTPGHSQLSAYCSPKGRMLALFRLFRRNDAYYLMTARERIEPVRNRLQMFVLRADVTLRDVSDDTVGIGLSGPNAVMLLTDATGEVPAAIDDVITIDDVSILRIPGEQPRFVLYGGVDAIRSIWRKLADNASPAGAEVWRLLDIRTGIPSVYDATADAFVPQMANLQWLDAISFDKGCYVGQEIVARTRYLGKLKRRMYRLYFGGDGDSDMLPSPGTELYAPELRDEQSVGKIVDACRSPDGGFEALAVLAIECAEDEDAEILLGNLDGVPVVVEELSYSAEA
jgi:folate-binding protein YgfZ